MASYDPTINFFDSPGGPKGAEKSMMVLTAKLDGDANLYFEDSHGNTYVGNEGMTQVMAFVYTGQDILIRSDLILD